MKITHCTLLCHLTCIFSCFLHAEHYGLNFVQAVVVHSFPDCDEGISPGDCNMDFGDEHFQLQFEIYFCVEPVILKVVLELASS